LGNNTPLYLSSSAVEIVSTLNVTSTITASNLSGTNTGDETKASIETKLGAATSSNSGYLTSTDWSTFNNKIAGTGTLNKLAKFSSSSSIADSTITDTGSAVTIGVATSVTGSLTASSLIRTGGTSSQFLKADGSVDSTTYTPTSRTLTINGTTYDLSSNRTWTINPSQWSTNPSGPGIEYGDTVSIGGLASYTEGAKLFVAAPNPDYGVVAKFKNSFESTPLTGTKIAFETNGIGEWRMGLDGGTDYFVINRYDSGSFTESFAIAGNGKVIIPNNVGIGITNPVNKLDVSGDGKFTGSLTANSIIKSGGTSSQFLKADGSVDSNSYALASSLSSYVPTSRTLTINGTAYDLSADRSWTISTGVTGTGTTNTLPKFTGTSAIANSNITDSGTLISLLSTTFIDGGLRIGPNSLTTQSVRVGKNITGGTFINSILSDGSVQSDVTVEANNFVSGTRTAAASFTLSVFNHFRAQQTSIGAGSAITTQNGFLVDNTLTGATTNVGFRGIIPSGAGRWNLYMDGTANNYLAGNLSIGTTSTNFRLESALSASVAIATPFRVTNSAAATGTPGQGSQIGFANDSGWGTGFSSTIRSQITNTANGASALSFHTYNGSSLNEYIRITSGGNVGIGTTTPGVKLQVLQQAISSNPTLGTGSGALFISGDTGAYGLYMGINTSTGNSWLQTMRNDAATAYNMLLQPVGGNVGIGTTSPSNKLSVVSSVSTTEILASFGTLNNSLRLAINSDGSSEISNGAAVASIHISQGSNKAITITDTRNVGIGTTSPASKLNVSGDNITVSAGYGIAWAGDQTRIMTPEDNVSGALIRYGSGGIMRFVNGSTEHMRINGSGNVGIGTSNPTAAASRTALVLRGNANGAELIVQSTSATDGTNAGFLMAAVGTGAYLVNRLSGPLILSTSDTERMRIDSGGYVQIAGTTTYNNSRVNIEVGTDLSGITTNVNSSDTRYHLYFRNTLATVGSISTNTYATSFNTSSDYRLKEDLKPFNGLSILKDIKVYDFKWKGVEDRNYGIVAHEIAEVIPYAVNGEKDGEMHQSVDYSKLVPVLIQAIQELTEKINKLENAI
jgi:hypothetical protein